MFRHAWVIIGVLLPVVLFLLAWYLHPVLFDIVTSSNTWFTGVNYSSPEAWLLYSIETASSFAAMGLSISLGMLLCARVASPPHYGRTFAILSAVALVGAAARTMVITRRVAFLDSGGGIEMIAEALPSGTGMNIQATIIPLHEIGLSGAISVVVASLILAVYRRRSGGRSGTERRGARA